MIRIMLTHLLDNSLKCSYPDHPITIAARIEGGKVIMYLADRGPGIRPEENEHLFDNFVRSNNQRHLQGTGMGLAIAREILRAHGEDIVVSSSPGEGPQFSFALPIAGGGIPQ